MPKYRITQTFAFEVQVPTQLAALACAEEVADEVRAHGITLVGTACEEVRDVDNDAPFGACILTGAEGENPDDCTTHDHEEAE